MTELDPEDLEVLAGKVASFLDTLPTAERDFLADVLAAAGPDGSASDVEGFALAANATQQRIFAQEQAINMQGAAAGDLSGGGSARRRASMDNMHKFLDIMRSMNPKI